MPLRLSADEQELLRHEVAAFRDLVDEPAARRRYEALDAAVEAGEVPDETLADLGAMLEVGLQTGRIRKLHRAPGEQALLRIFGKTPPGEVLAANVADLNRALGQLAGQEIETVSVWTRVPGVYLLKIATDQCEMTLRFTPDGASVEAIELGI
jgi:hypothetical protein